MLDSDLVQGSAYFGAAGPGEILFWARGLPLAESLVLVVPGHTPELIVNILHHMLVARYCSDPRVVSVHREQIGHPAAYRSIFCEHRSARFGQSPPELHWWSVWTRQDEGRPWLFSGYYLAPLSQSLGWQDCTRLRVVPWGREGHVAPLGSEAAHCHWDPYDALRPTRHSFPLAGGSWRNVFASPGYAQPVVWDGYLYAGPDNLDPIALYGAPGTRIA